MKMGLGEIATNRPPFVACLLAASITGCSYTFSVYSGALKKQFALQQSQLDTISTLYFCAGVLSWIPGILVDCKGPRFAVVFGGILQAISLTAYWAVARKVVHVGSNDAVVAVLSCLGILIFVGSACITGTYCATMSRNNPERSGTAVGCAKGWVGLCGGMFTQIFAGLVRKPDDNPQTLDFILMCAGFGLLGTVGPSPMFAVSTAKKPLRDTLSASDISFIYVLLGLMAIVVTCDAFVKDRLSKAGQTALAVIIIVLWTGPFLLLAPCVGPSDADDEGKAVHPAVLDDKTAALLKNGASDEDGEGESDDESVLPQLTLTEMLQQFRCWLLLWTCVWVIGAGIMLSNNASQMCESLGFKSFSSTAVTIFSVSQSGSRVLGGFVSEQALRHNIPRPFFLVIASAMMMTAHLVFAFTSSKGGMLLGVVLCGLAFGSTWPLMVLSVGEFFGKRHLGSNYMLYDGMTSAVGTLVLSKLVAQSSYESHIHGGGTTCYGKSCFRESHLIIAALLTTCVVSSTLALWQTRPLYKRIIEELKTA